MHLEIRDFSVRGLRSGTRRNPLRARREHSVARHGTFETDLRDPDFRSSPRFLPSAFYFPLCLQRFDPDDIVEPVRPAILHPQLSILASLASARQRQSPANRKLTRFT